MKVPLTASEAKFEEFLRENDLPFERVPVADAPRPDYLVNIDEIQIFFEVKDLTKDDNFNQGDFGLSSRTVGDHIRTKISQSRKQVKYGAGKGIPSVLLIYNALDPLHLFGTEQHDFTAAMYGEQTLTLNKDTGQITDRYSGRNFSFSEEKKNYFSALGHFEPIQKGVFVTLYENLYAAVPMPYDILPPCFRVVRFTLSR